MVDSYFRLNLQIFTVYMENTFVYTVKQNF
jgi:hypothetical protein